MSGASCIIKWHSDFTVINKLLVLIHNWCFSVSCLAMSVCWYSQSFCLARIRTSPFCQMLPLLVLNLLCKCFKVHLSFVDIFLFFFSLLLLFVTVNFYKTRMRHFIVVRMSSKSNQDMLVVTENWVPPFWNLPSVAAKTKNFPFLSVFQVCYTLMFSATGSVLYSVCWAGEV